MLVHICRSDNPTATLSVVAHWSDVPDDLPGIEIDPVHLQRLWAFGASVDAVEEVLELADFSDEPLTIDGFTYQATPNTIALAA